MKRSEEKEDLIYNFSNLVDKAKDFHENIVKKLLLLSINNFNKIRKNVLINLTKINHFFDDNRILQIYFNNFHLVKLFTNNLRFFETECESFIHFFYTSLMFVSKIENENYYEVLREKAIFDKINLDITDELVSLILRKMNKYYNFSCEEIFLCLMQLMNQFEGFQADSDFKKNFDIYILFALSEFTLFSTYDQVTLTCACIMLEFRSSKDEKTMNSFLRVLCELNLNENDVLSCLSSITNELSLNETETETSKKKFKKFKKRKQ